MWTLFVAFALLAATVWLPIDVYLALDLLQPKAALTLRLFGLVPIRLYLVKDEENLVLSVKPFGRVPLRAKKRTDKPLLRLLRPLLRTIHWKADLNLLLGTGQDHTTAWVCSALHLLPRTPLVVRVYPTGGDVCKGYLQGKMNICLWRLLS